MWRVERIVELRDQVTGGEEVYDYFAERCLGSATYGLLGAGGGLAATDHSLPISDIRRSSAFSLGRIRAAASWLRVLGAMGRQTDARWLLNVFNHNFCRVFWDRGKFSPRWLAGLCRLWTW